MVDSRQGTATAWSPYPELGLTTFGLTNSNSTITTGFSRDISYSFQIRGLIRNLGSGDVLGATSDEVAVTTPLADDAPLNPPASLPQQGMLRSLLSGLLPFPLAAHQLPIRSR